MKHVFFLLIATLAIPVFAESEAVNRICSSGAPILVVDDFAIEPTKTHDEYAMEKPYIDLNGDGSPDGAHGDLVVAICRVTGKRCDTFNLPQRLPKHVIVAAFNKILEKIESGAIEKPIALNVSARLYLDIKLVNSLGLTPELTPANLAQHREPILKAVLDAQLNAGLYEPLYEIFQRFSALGIALITTTGNDGSPDVFNYYSLMPGAITVGAFDYKHRPAPYTNQNSLAMHYRTGDFFARTVPGGIDIDGDSAPEFPEAKLSRGTPVSLLYSGKSLEQAITPFPENLKNMRSAPNFKKLVIDRKMLKEGVYKNSEFLPDGGTEADKAMQDYIHVPSYMHFSVKAGRLDYDPAEDGDVKKVKSWHGTSFAAPYLCGK